MKKMIKFFLTFTATILLFSAFSFSSYAVCDEDAIKRDITKNVDSTASLLRKSLENYNRATKNFEASCG